MDEERLAEEARALLRTAPAEFVAARNRRVRELRPDDKALAAAVGSIRKPAPAAWVIDLLAAEGHLDDAVALGPSLRAAQERSDPGEIRRLRGERRALVEELVRSGADLAGQRLTDAVLTQVAATIEAAMADPRAGDAVRSGLLVRPLESVGFEDVDLDGALAVGGAAPPANPPIPITAGRRGAGARSGRRSGGAEPTRASRPAQPTAAERAATERAERETARQEARAAEESARADSRAADEAAEAADAALDEAQRRRDELTAELRRLERDLERLASDRDDAEQRADDARAALSRARKHRREVG